MATKQIFRKVALDRLSSPEELDQVMHITTAKGWIVFGTVALLLVTTTVWGVLGTLSEKVSGRGILVKTGGVLEVVASASGRVTDVPISVGESISEGQVVAWVAQPDLLDQLEQTRSELAAVRAEHAQNAKFRHDQTDLKLEQLRKEAAGLRQSIANDSDQLVALEERLAAQKQLVDKGLLARPTLLESRQARDRTKEARNSSQSRLQQIAVEKSEAQNQLAETLRQGELKIANAEAKLKQLQENLRASSQVVSPYTGRVLEVMTEKGKLLNRGEPVLSLDLTGQTVQNLVAIIYVPSIHGKKVRPGMEINVAPATIPREEYGMMVGRVTLVSDYPATPQGMLRVLKNEQLVRELSGGGAPYEVHAELIVDPSTPSSYRWTSSGGPPTTIESGTVATAFVTLAIRAPHREGDPALPRMDRNLGGERRALRSLGRALLHPSCGRDRRLLDLLGAAREHPPRRGGGCRRCSRWRPSSAAPPPSPWCWPYYGQFVPLEELRVDCGVSRDGSKASNVLRAARRYGLRPRASARSRSSSRRCGCPSIIHWNFNHFVVLEGFGKNVAYLNDPAEGPDDGAHGEEFDEAFTGVVLTFEPGPEFEAAASSPSLVWRP